MAEVQVGVAVTRVIEVLQSSACDAFAQVVQRDAKVLGLAASRLDAVASEVLRRLLELVPRWMLEKQRFASRRSRVLGSPEWPTEPVQVRIPGCVPRIARVPMKLAPAWNSAQVQAWRWQVIGQLSAKDAEGRRGAAKRRREFPRGTLDARATKVAKQMQADGDAWGPTMVAKHPEVGSDHSSLLRMKDGKPSCPLFYAFWDDVQRYRAQRKLDRSAKLREGRE